MASLHYRPDIDGLRAIAVLLVLGYHGHLPWIHSGFVGVDVFFVISGFLITTILSSSLHKGTFSFLDFYNRRLWRLQPAFICLLLCTLLLTLLLFLPDDLIEFGRSARKASLFVSNLFFSHATTTYFAQDAMQMPLLHTWSLSIEWQCYLLLPVFLFALHRFLPQQMIAPVMLLLTLLSLGILLHHSVDDPAQAYYKFASRIFEFLVGASVALFTYERQTQGRFIVTFFGFLALGTILFIGSQDNILLGFPNYYAVSVCLATGSIIAIGSLVQNSVLSKVLSSKPLVFIGLISYSLYLWHWVVFSLLRYQGVGETVPVLLGAYLVSFLLGYLSWRFIEKPARKHHGMPYGYSLLILLVAPILVIHLVSFTIKANSGFPSRFNQELAKVYETLEQYDSKQRPLCISKSHIDEAQCRIGDTNAASKTALMIGDSFANHYWRFMDTLGKAAHVSILSLSTSSCLVLPGIYHYDWWTFKKQIYQECFAETEKYFQMIAKNHYDYVIIGQIWPNYLSTSIINHEGDKQSIGLAKKRIRRALDAALRQIEASGAKPIFIKNTASMQQNFHDCFFKHIKLHQSYDPKQCDFTLALSPGEQWFDGLFALMQKKYPALILIDPKKVQCMDGQCKVDVDGVPVYRDAGHITDYASYRFGKLYAEQFDNPLG